MLLITYISALKPIEKYLMCLQLKGKKLKITFSRNILNQNIKHISPGASPVVPQPNHSTYKHQHSRTVHAMAAPLLREL